MEQGLNEQDNEFYLFCFLVGDKKLIGGILTAVFVFINTGVVCWFSYKLLKNRQQFPIMERSPLLSVVAILFANFQVSGQACIALIQKPIEQKPDFRDSDLVDDIGVLVFSLSMIFRTIRLDYAFKGSNIVQQSKLKMKIYGNQTILASISIFSSILLAMIPFSLEHQNNMRDSNDQTKTHLIFKITVLSVTTVIILIYGRHLKMFNVNFNLATESLLLALQLFLLINIKFWIYKWGSNDCYIENSDQILNFIFLCALVINIAIIPLRDKKKYHEILPPSLILDEFSLFIANSQNVIVFYQYLKNLDSVGSNFLNEIPSNIAEILRSMQQRLNSYFHTNMLIFYIEYYGKSLEESKLNLDVLETIFPIVDITDQQELRQTFLQDANINLSKSVSLEDSQYQPVKSLKLAKQIIEKNLNQVKLYLDCLYKEHFKKTKSFSFIQDQFYYNEQVALNLYNLNMTRLNESLLSFQGIRKIQFGSIVEDEYVA